MWRASFSILIAMGDQPDLSADLSDPADLAPIQFALLSDTQFFDTADIRFAPDLGDLIDELQDLDARLPEEGEFAVGVENAAGEFAILYRSRTEGWLFEHPDTPAGSPAFLSSFPDVKAALVEFLTGSHVASDSQATSS